MQADLFVSIHADTFIRQRLTVTRIGGPDNDRLSLKGTFPLGDMTAKPTETGFTLEVTDAAGVVVSRSTVPAGAMVDSGGGRLFRFTDRDKSYPEANGMTAATFKPDASRGSVKMRLGMRNYDIPGIVDTPNVAVALLFGDQPESDACVTDASAPCIARNTRVICTDPRRPPAEAVASSAP